MVKAPLVVVAGPTASGKSHLALALAGTFAGEIVSCDSVAVYRGLDVGSAKPSQADRAQVPHHLLDVVSPDQPYTAGDYSREARQALAGIAAQGALPIVTGGTGLYLRALIDGLFPAPPPEPILRERLRSRPATQLHRILQRLDTAAASRIHPNDTPKLVRAIEVSLSVRGPMSEQWQAGRAALSGYRILRLGLNPPRQDLYARINHRAAAMFSPDLPCNILNETKALLARYGPRRSFESLGYAQAAAALRCEVSMEDAVRQTQQGHRNYAKRQLTWFRREPGYVWLSGFGDESRILVEATRQVAAFLHRS